jgi:hypothetical protein
MKHACSLSCGRCGAASTEISERRFSAGAQQTLFSLKPVPLPGSLDDAALVRSALTKAIRDCNKSREQIAECMSRLTGTQVTVRQLNNFTAEAREDCRFPLEFLRAFSVATGDFSVLSAVVRALGLEVITETENSVLALGREYLRQKRAAENMQSLEELLAKREL